ncbi:MAG: ABC transporter substrate-binding protein, partial [Mycobacterium sp.]
MLARAVLPGVSAAAVITLTLLSACSKPSEAPAAGPTNADRDNSVVTSTTKIASAGVLGNQRRPDESCAPEPARLDPPPPEGGVPDPQRIVVLTGAELDALCALGLQSRIVAAALADGAAGQPSYLGTVVHDIPPAGTGNAPDLGAVAAARPDLILGSAQQGSPALMAIAPTVLLDGGPAGWQDHLRRVGAATGRGVAADELIAGFTAAAREKGAANDATHFQASIVQLTDTTLRVWGAENFPASVLAAVGVD